MSHVFKEAARTIDLPWVRECKEKGMKIVGYTCSFLPVEVFHAAGILPVRLRGIHAESMNIGDAYYGPFVCTFPKALLQKAGEGEYRFLDGAVITAGCDGMRRIDECWRKMGDDIHGTLPGWFYYLDLPHKPDGVSFEWYESRIRKLVQAVENAFDVTITDEKLRQAVKSQNRVREAVWELNRLRHGETVHLSGTEAFEAMIARTVLPPDLYLEELTRLIDDVTSRTTSVSDGKKRLFLAGSICDDLDLVRQIEEAGALVVGETLCYGARNTCEKVDEEGDPVTALCAHYLSGSVCPRMFGYYETRLSAITERINQSRADGVVMQNIRFCDLHGSENGLLERDLEKMGIPAIRIEREYGPLTEKGRLRMRIDAFLEQIDSKERSCS